MLNSPRMHPFVGAFPILPGKEEQVKAFAKEVNRRMSELDASEKRQGITKEFWSLASSPQGSMVLVYIESIQDAEKTFADFADSKDPIDVWLKSQVKEFAGVDLSAPLPGPMPEILLLYGY